MSKSEITKIGISINIEYESISEMKIKAPRMNDCQTTAEKPAENYQCNS